MQKLKVRGAEKEFACQVFPIFSREILGSDLELRAGFGKGFISTTHVFFYSSSSYDVKSKNRLSIYEYLKMISHSPSISWMLFLYKMEGKIMSIHLDIQRHHMVQYYDSLSKQRQRMPITMQLFF
ncbi:predicted protein [Sclerotinia sclerotiorum 1980 UF-70]|uniref:Uncharacterized protein n=1 Tax=Sclerotinia sclerotiorum (strain ATCC 18683 / 1980 / Ss-1) TaxID=665079 RepID=A7E911_SCLS1|nr:predicted protein [Sclerotinia sclerotiorum 1980 UF-70]EDN96863.1 predicted protein [Sclerotinia sclerotiorum 1980 UF-70]